MEFGPKGGRARGAEIQASGLTKQLLINWWLGRKSYNFPPLQDKGDSKQG